MSKEVFLKGDIVAFTYPGTNIEKIGKIYACYPEFTFFIVQFNDDTFVSAFCFEIRHISKLELLLLDLEE